jgi:putative transposase
MGYKVNHKKVWRLMKEMGLKAVYAKPRTTIIDKTHNKYPYLLKDLIIDKPNQVWAIDIIPIIILNDAIFQVSTLRTY